MTAVDHISGHFRSIRIFYFFLFFDKMAAGAHFGCPKMTFDRISSHFRSICNFNFLGNLDKMAAIGHSLPIVFLPFSGHFRSICNLIFLEILTKWLPSAILDVQNSLSITFLAISDRYSTFFFFGNFWQNGCRRPFWMSEINFRSHFWPF